ncbi:MAG: Jag N-terminal domain-containing protein [Desulfarculaceae bacterium]|nr:Jag N-terminal domain-containing protein [Desulfarculaceae bacterium]
MKRTQEFDGKDIESAVKNACTELSLSRSQLKYDVISTGATGIFGIVGRKNARIRVKLPDAETDKNERSMNDEEYEGIMSIVDEAFGQEADAGGPSDAGAEKKEKRPSYEKADDQKASAKKEQHRSSTAAPEADKESSEIEKTEHKAGTETKEKTAHPQEFGPEKRAETPAEKPAPEQAEPEIEKPFEPVPEPQTEEAPAESVPESDEELEQEVVEVSPELAELAEQAVKRMVDLITEDAAVTSEIEGDKLTIRVDGGNAGILIGRKGQTLEAMQFLADKIVNRKSEARVRVKVDIEGYMETRKANLRQLAFKMAEKAKKTGRPATINQMSGQDRRTIHLTLKDDSKVRTQSKGDGYYRRLVILPKKKGSLNSKKRYRK